MNKPSYYLEQWLYLAYNKWRKTSLVTEWLSVERIGLKEDLMIGSSIPAVAQGYSIFPAQKDERHQEQLHSSGFYLIISQTYPYQLW